MCGITGFVGLNDDALLKKMCNVIKHRGPNDWGTYTDKNIGLGIRRLSIIDIKGGHQPVHNEDRTIWIVFNGEIYNFQELRNIVEKRGHRFYTDCDTEVIVHLYEVFGEKCVDYLRGMFAFALWDSNNKRLFLARDRLGKKPLYYTYFDGKFLFGSEIKSILQCTDVKRAVNLQSMHEFLTLQYVPGPKTMFKDIWKLQPGSTLTLKKGTLKLKKYWDITVTDKNKDEVFCSKKVLELFKESVKIRMMSEVPIGSYLSGGVDSSAVTAFMSMFSDKPVNTFTVGFGHHTDEFEYARLIAEKFKTNHKEILMEQKSFNLLPEILWHFDEPIADPAALPTYLISKETKKHATVALVGEGGDEAFAGYEKYGIMMRVYRNRISRLAFNSKTISGASLVLGVLKKTKKTEFLSEFSKAVHDPAEAFSRLSALGFIESEKQDLYSDGLKKNKFKTLGISKFSGRKTIFQNMLLYDMKYWLPDRLLMKVDKMTMANSVEARAPFMDHKLVEFSNTISPRLRINKYVLKKAIFGIVPKEILKRKKHGFAVPIGDWFKEDLHGIAANILDKYHLDYFKKGYVKQILENSRKVRNDHKLWNLLNFYIWHNIYIDNFSEGSKLRLKI